MYLFPQDYGLWDAGIKRGLRCYNDSIIHFDANISSTCDEILTSIHSLSNSNLIEVSPNPFSNQIQLNIPSSSNTEVLQFNLYNNLGQSVLEKTITENSSPIINVPSTIPQGVYYGVLSIGNQIQTAKLIKQ